VKINIRQVLDSKNIIKSCGRMPLNVTGITQDSRLIKKGFVFIARSGGRVNGLNFIRRAEKQGASLVVTDQKLPDDISLPAVRVKDLHEAVLRLTKHIYDDPTSSLKLIGITGTNGKTTSVHLIRSILECAGEKCGMLSTLGYFTTIRNIPADLTTPDVDKLGSILCEMVEAGCGWAVMEVSSHALIQGRTDGIRFAAAGFTNLTQEHLDYHQSMEDYAAAKASLFAKLTKDDWGIVNNGDPCGEVMIKASKGKVITYTSKENEADIHVTTLEHSLSGGHFRLDLSDRFREIISCSERSLDVRTPLIGEYHGENIALAAGIALCMGFELANIKAGIEKLKSVQGRMERVEMGQPFGVLVDYSHTPDALKNALSSIRTLCTKKLTVVFGCGGDRDRTKRPEMGLVASEIADQVIITTDNSRSERPGSIAEEIMSGIKRRGRRSASVELDRRLAIRQSFKDATNGDVVLISGKGHESYQDIDGVRLDFDDRLIAAEELDLLGWTNQEKGEVHN